MDLLEEKIKETFLLRKELTYTDLQEIAPRGRTSTRMECIDLSKNG